MGYDPRQRRADVAHEQNVIELHGVTCTVPKRWSTYTDRHRQQVTDLVASLARAGADQFTLYSVTPRDNGRATLSYSYSMPPRRDLPSEGVST